MFKNVYSLYSAFYPGLHFTLSLQSAFYTQSAFYPWSAKFGYIFSRVGKTKNSKSTAMCFQRRKKVYLKTCSEIRHVFPLRFIYSQAK